MISETISLVDKMSDPARSAGNAIRALAGAFDGLASKAGALTALGESLKSLGSAGQLAGSIVSTIGRIGEAGFQAASKITGAFGKLIGVGGGGGHGASGGGGGGLGDAASLAGPEAAMAAKAAAFAQESIGAIVGAVQEAMAAVISGTAEFLKVGLQLSIEASTARTEAVDVLGKTLGSAEAGEAKYDELGKMARSIGIGRDKALSEWKRLSAAGFKDDAIPKLVEQMENIEKGRGAGSGMRLERLLTRTQAAGKLDMAGVKAASKQLGISQNDIIADLASKLHKTTQQVTTELKKGVDATKGQEAILDAVDKKFGGLAKKGAESIPALLGALSDQFTSLFDKVNLDPLKNTLKGISTLLDSSIGGELKNAVTDLFGAVFTTLFGETAKGGDKMVAIFRGVTAFVNDLAGAVRAVAPLVSAFVRGLLGAAAAAMGEQSGGSWITNLQAQLPELIPQFEEAGARIVAIAGKIWTVGSAIAKFTYMVIGYGVALFGAISKFADSDLGKNTIDVLKGALLGLAAVAFLIAAPFIGFGIALVLLAVTLGAVAEACVWLGDVMMEALGSAAEWVKEKFQELKDWFKGLGFSDAGVDLGSDLSQGLIDGIFGGQSGVVSAIIQMASAAIGAGKNTLKTHSPSEVFEDIGGYTAEGLAVGITGGTGHVVAAVGKLGNAAAAVGVPGIAGAGAGAAGDAAGKAGSGAAIHIEHLEIHASDAAGGKAAAEAFDKHFNDKLRHV